MLLMREYRIGDEPIPNYRLVRFLGRGGFGEVWQAKAPGGIEVAMKFIRLDKKAGKKEFESLRVVKRIKHPHLMAINAFWLKDADGNVLDDDSVDLLGMNLLAERGGRKSATETTFFAQSQAAELVIALELCDKNLLDRLRECQSAGLQGIPPDELLDYMEGCAKAIDYLNSPVHVLEDGEKKAVQHCDIKPQNIMLLSGEPKVCDFGLVRAQSDVRKTAIAASLAYAPPEILIKGQQSEATDQYSLAVSYYELRTGELPFSEETANHFAIMKAHEQGTLDFSRLPDGERAVIERATMLNPAARFGRTADMVAALRRAHRGESDLLPASGPAERLQSGQELVPGYVLKDYLFRADGRTEVWDATRANGDEHALWIYDLTSYRGEIDVGALRRLRAGSHPQLASVFDFWLLDAERRLMQGDRAAGAAPPRTLVIASERTRDNLVFLVDECRRRSGDGLPAERLLDCLKQVALALDALNSGDSGCGPIAHCDVRPANLLVFGHTTKLGNFAWCRGLSEGSAELPEPSRRSEWRTTAPEVVHGKPSPQSDQYSLADSYVQMRTGQLLGDSLSSSSQSSGRLSGRLDLTVLRQDEQQVVRRALSEVPAERYSSCSEFIEQLTLVVQPVPARAVADDGRVQTLEPGDLSSPAKWKDTRPIKKTPTAPIETPKPARRGVRRVAFVTMLLGGMAVSAVMLGRMYVEQSVDRALVDREMETALAVLKQFERFPLLIAPDLPGRVVRRADERVADDWHRSQKVYDGLVSGWPAEPGLEELKDKLIVAGVKEFHDLIEKDPEAAETLRVSLAESFAGDGRVQRLPKIEPWENKVRGLLASARKKLGERLTVSAKNDCEAAGALLDSHPSAQADLRHDLLLLRVAVCVQTLDWQQAERLLSDADDQSFDRAAPRLLARRAALRAIIGTHYTGGKLDPSRTDEMLKAAAAELAASDEIAPGWSDEGDDEFEARLAPMLVDELVLRAVDFVFSGVEGRRNVGETLLTDLSRLRAVGDQLPVRMAKSMLLLCRPGQPATADELGASMETWVDSKKLPTDSRDFAGRVTAIADAVVQWGLCDGNIESAEEHLQHLSANSGVSVTNELLLLGEKSLRSLVNESPPPWKKIKAKCGELGYLANTSKQREAAFVLAARAECVIELSADENRATDVAQALEIIASLAKRNSQIEGDADRPYFDYVDLLARDAADNLGQEDEWLPLADSLSVGLTSAVPGPLLVPERASRGRVLLGRLAVKLLGLYADGQLDRLQPLDIDPAQAERVFGWLGTGGPPSAAESGNVEFALAVAALNKQPPDSGVAAEMLDALTASGRTDRQILLLKAASSPNAEAIGWYAKVLEESRSRSADDDPLTVYQRVVEPAIEILEAMPDERQASIGKAAALIYAEKGRLIRRSLLVENDVVAKAQTKAAELIFNAYNEAAALDPSEADYFIERGTARYEWRSSDLDGLLGDIQCAEKLLGQRQPAAFFGLKGANSILRARSQPLTAPQDRINFYKEAIASYEAAVTQSDRREARFLILLSAANVELANATTEPDAELLKYLEAAKANAEAATKLPAAHPEDAWLALGNAIEDCGLLPRQTDRVRYDWYSKAIKAFDQAEVIAQQNNLPNALLLISRGRVRYRMATCGWQPQQAAEDLSRALVDLRSAAEQIQIEDAELAEADLWQSRVQSELGQLASVKAVTAQNSAAAASNQAARAEQQRRMEAETKSAAAARAAAIEAMRAAMANISVEDVNWPIYQGYWLQLATTRAEQAERASALLKWPRIADAPETRATAIDALAAASESSEAGLQVYLRELRIGKDFSQVSDRDGWGLVYLCNFIALRADVWAKHADLCKGAGQLALKLAEKSHNPELDASACAALALHEAQRASRPNAATPEKSAALAAARVYLKRCLQFADSLPTASLLSLDRQRLERERCWDWRMSLAILGARYSNARWLSDEIARALWADALSATETGYQPPLTVEKFALKRRELLTIGTARGFKRESKK